MKRGAGVTPGIFRFLIEFLMGSGATGRVAAAGHETHTALLSLARKYLVWFGWPLASIERSFSKARPMLPALVYVVIGLPLLAVTLHTIVRVIRYFYKFPMPELLANLIDNPLRRKIQPPGDMPLRHGVMPGMTVLEVGPGNGRYTVETARRVGSAGRVITVDIEPKMIARVLHRARVEGLANLEARVADVHNLPFEDGVFAAVCMITVIGEIPEPERAMREFYRVLSPSGILAFSELLTDPDYPLAQTLVRRAGKANFRLKKKLGNFFSYTLVFEKQPPDAA